MRVLIFVWCCIFCLETSSQIVDKQTVKALDYIHNGYVRYGVSELRQAASVNDITAQFFLARCYESGIGVEKDKTEAFRLYRRAAERGLGDAMYYLASCYKYGIGVSRDVSRSNEWMQRYKNKGGRLILPNIEEIYNVGLGKIENFALNPTEKGNKEYAQNVPNAPAEIIHNITVVQQTIKEEVSPVSLADDNKEIAKPDVDQNIPVNPQDNISTFALIIANEHYQDVANVQNALNDGVVFSEYCKNTLGIPSKNIHLIKDATLNNIKKEVNYMKQIADAYCGKVNFIIYYAGHGVPDEATGRAYLLPIDGYGSDLTTGYSLSDFYDALGNMPSQKTVVVLDACFSGATRGDGMLASARGVAIKAKVGLPKGNTVVFSSAQGDETAYPYMEKNHGLFTYFFLKKLQETKGYVTLGELIDYVKDNVVKNSLVVNGKSQTPTVISSQTVNNWCDWKLNE